MRSTVLVAAAILLLEVPAGAVAAPTPPSSDRPAPPKRHPKAPTASAAPQTARVPATPLAFADFFEASPRELKPSRKLLSLDGRRVRIVGFMARLAHSHLGEGGVPPTSDDHRPRGADRRPSAPDRPPSRERQGAADESHGHGHSSGLLPDGFYLCPRPTDVAEGGGGTGDLPPSAVRVVIPSAMARALHHTSRPVAVVGRLELGPKPEANGQVSTIRIYVDAGRVTPRAR